MYDNENVLARIGQSEEIMSQNKFAKLFCISKK